MLLGKGTYNVAILSDKGHVVRVGNVDKREIREDILRGASIVNGFQVHRKLLGPSLVVQIERGTLQLNKDFAYRHIQGVPAAAKLLHVQSLEHLQGGGSPAPDTSAEAVAFPLVWFLCAAQTRFGFAHNDLKWENIVFRNYDYPQDFLFCLGGRAYYSVKTRQIPVIIDFDYATVHSTSDKSAVGTQYTQPPEILVSMFLSQIEALEDYERVGAHDDWWSLGITLYKWWLPARWRMPSVYQVYLEAVLAHYHLSSDEHKNADWGHIAIKNMFRAYCIVKQLGLVNIPETHPVFFGGQSRVFLEMGAKDWRRLNPVCLSNFQVKLLRRLLSWHPSERHYYGSPWKLITDHFKQTTLIAREPDFQAKLKRKVY